MNTENLYNTEAEKVLIAILFQLSDFDNWETPEEINKIDPKLFTEFKPVFIALKENWFTEAWKWIAKGKIYPEEKRNDVENYYLNYISGGTSRESVIEEMKKILIELKEKALERENKILEEKIKWLNEKEASKEREKFNNRKENIRTGDELEEINNDPVNNIINRIEGKEEEQNKKYLTWLTKFDEFIQFRPGQVNIIGARPSVWKSLLALNLAIRNLRAGLKVWYFSFEMGEEQVLTRIYSLLSWIPVKMLWERINDGQIKEKLLEKISFFQERREQKQFIFSEKYTISEVIKQIRLWRKYNGTEIFYIDHIGLLRGDKTKQRYQEIWYIAEELKHLAEELKITIILLSQLNRQTNVNDYWERPQLIHLSESGILEQIGSIIILLYRDFREESDTKNELEVLIRKNRDGQTGEIILNIDPAYMIVKD